MTRANYSVIRYIADPARDEPANIGVLVQTESGLTLKSDEAALQRVIRDNPHLDGEALEGLEALLREILADTRDSIDSFAEVLKEVLGQAFNITEPRYTTVDMEIENGLDITIERLLSRLVRPRHRSTESAYEPGAVAYFRRRFNPLILTRAVMQDYPFQTSKSGTMRTVDFFANSSAKVALDIVPLQVRDERMFNQRVDAEAGKIYDILGKNTDVRFLVFFDLRSAAINEVFNESRTDRAKHIIGATGAKVTTDRNEAADSFERQAKTGIWALSAD